METFWQQLVSYFAEHQTAWRILVIVLLSVFVWWLLRWLLKRAVRRIAAGVGKTPKGSDPHDNSAVLLRERTVGRVRTLGAVGRSAITWVVCSVAIILILTQLGIDLSALLTSAGLVGAALAFGAQSIVKDVLNGIFMVFEDQLGVGDWITVGQVSGTVEDVGVRVTQVRALDGTLWFIRNGEILELGNASQGFGKAIVDIAVSSENDMAEVERIMLLAATEVLKREEYRKQVTGAPEMLGVQSVAGDRVTLRCAVDARADAQWVVQRALRGEINRQFMEHGIKLAKQLYGPAGEVP